MVRAAQRPFALRTKILLLVVAAVGLVGLAEVILRLAPPGGVLDIESLAAQAAENVGIVRADAVLGHVPVLDGRGYDGFGLLRRWGPRGSVATRREGVVRVLLLGDTVNGPLRIAEPLRDLWRATPSGARGGEFLDASVEGWNPVQEVEFYFRHQRQLAPDHVVVALRNDDLSDAPVACVHDEDLTLCAPGALVPVDVTWYRRSALYRLLVHRRYADGSRGDAYTARSGEVIRALARLRDEVVGRGAELTVLVMPVGRARSDWTGEERIAFDALRRYLEALGVTVVDLEPVAAAASELGLPVDSAATVGALQALAAAEALFGTAALSSTAAPRIVARGGSQTVRVAAGPDYAGRRVLVLGSLRGIEPATDLPRGQVTLAEDDYLLRTADRSAPLFAGELDGGGDAEIEVPVPAGAAPGSVVWHVAVVADRRGIHYERIGWPMPMIVPAR